MYRLFAPDMQAETLFDIDTNALRTRGIRGIILDLDNTIVPWDNSDVCPRIADWLRQLTAQGFRVAVVSNNWQKRVRAICVAFGLPFVSRAYKPARAGFRRALASIGLEASETAVIGDQLFTDVLGGNRMGMYTIWVKPLTAQEFIGTRVHRRLEHVAVRYLKARGLIR